MSQSHFIKKETEKVLKQEKNITTVEARAFVHYTL